jgi:hypothetical protein
VKRSTLGRRSILSVFVALLVVPSARATPTHDARVAALRATLARGGLALEKRGDGVVAVTAGCNDVVDRLQPDSCQRCILADNRDTTDEVLERITAVVERYPTEMLAQADIHTLSLCRRLENIAAQKDTMGGLSEYDGRHVMILVSKPEFLADILHHELFHMIESARIADLTTHDQEWESANPIGFSYGTGPSSSEAGKARPAGFVRQYAASNLAEDRASTFEYMMAEPDELCEMATNDPIVHAKVKIIWSRMKRYAGGYELMNSVAPCVRIAASP